MVFWRHLGALCILFGSKVAFAQAAPPTDPPTPPALTPPRLVTAAEAPYPEAAKEAGKEGVVQLRLTISEKGVVETVERVSEPLGLGLDEAAADAATRFVFEPATRDGKPVSARIIYDYVFDIAEPAPVPVEEKKTATLKGVVRSQEGDFPLRDVEITMGERRTKTNAEGAFEFVDLPAATSLLRVRGDGYLEGAFSEELVPGESREVVYRLALAPVKNEVVVVGERLVARPEREVVSRVVSSEELAKIPGAAGDPLRALESLPGLARSAGGFGALIVRGSAPDETGVFIDGTSVPLAYHFGGFASVLPAESLERIDFYPGNFSVRYGRFLGGIIDIGMRPPDTQCRKNGEVSEGEDCFHGLAQVDLINTRLMLSGPVSDDWSFSVAGRRSWLDAWLGRALSAAGVASNIAAPVYYDYQAAVNHKINATDSLSFRLFGSDDTFRLVLDDTGDPAVRDLGIATRFVRGQILYSAQPLDNLTFSAMLSGGWTSNEFGVGAQSFDFEDVPIEWRVESTYRPIDWLAARVGVDWSVTPRSLEVTAPRPTPQGQQTPGPLASQRLLTTSSSFVEHQPAAYAEVELTPHERVSIVPGLRFDFSRRTEDATFDPRLSAKAAIWGAPLKNPEREPQTLLRGGIGLFGQPPDLQQTDQVFGTPEANGERSMHATFGVQQRFTPNLSLAADGYYKQLFNLVLGVPVEGGGFEYRNVGDGRAYGLEVLLRYDPDDTFFGWVAYTLSRTTRNLTEEGQQYLTNNDQTHNLTVVGSFKLGSGWELGGRFRLISGNPYTPTSSSLPGVYSANGTDYVNVDGDPNSGRLPLFHQLDIRADKKWQFEDWAFSMYLDIQNIYNHQAAEAIAYSYDYSRTGYQYGLTILPSFGLRGEF
jgi:TonB family protein